MSTLENRKLALEAALAISAKDGFEWTRVANDALNFLETGSFSPAADKVQPANPPVAEPAPRKPRAIKPSSASTAESSEVAPAPAVLVPISAPASAGAAQPAAPIAVAATPNKEPTLDDVRNALVQCQTRKGGKDVPQAILNKYSSNKTTGGLAKTDYSKVISECAAA